MVEIEIITAEHNKRQINEAAHYIIHKTSLAPTGQKRKRIREMCQTSEIFGRPTTES